MKLRRPRNHGEFWPYLTEQERQDYTHEAKLRKWALDRAADHAASMRQMEVKAKRRKMSVMEAAE